MSFFFPNYSLMSTLIPYGILSLYKTFKKTLWVNSKKMVYKRLTQFRVQKKFFKKYSLLSSFIQSSCKISEKSLIRILRTRCRLFDLFRITKSNFGVLSFWPDFGVKIPNFWAKKSFVKIFTIISLAYLWQSIIMHNLKKWLDWILRKRCAWSRASLG